jgi:hypothetical protein
MKCGGIVGAFVSSQFRAARDASVEIFRKGAKCAALTGVAVVSGVSDITGGAALKTTVKAGLRAWGTGRAARILARNETVREHAPAAIAESNTAAETAGRVAAGAAAGDVATSAGTTTVSEAAGSNVELADWLPGVSTVRSAAAAGEACNG